MKRQYLASVAVVLALLVFTLAGLAEEEDVDLLIPKLATRDQAVTDPVMEKIVEIGDPAVPALIKALNESSSSWVRSRSAKLLGIIGNKEAVKPLVEKVTNEKANKYVRSASAYALGKIGDKEAVPVLIEAVKDKEKRVRGSAISALGEIGDERAVPVLKEVLMGSTDIKTKNSAVYALRKVDGTSKILLEALKDNDEYIRKDAAAAIVAQKGGLSVLKGALKSGDDPRLRKNICLALGQLRSSEAVPELEAALSDEDAKVRMAAVMALLSIGDGKSAKAVAALLKDKDPNVRVCASGALIHLGGEKEVPALAEALEDQDARVRANACKALGHIGGAAAEKAVAGALDDPDRWVSLSAAQSLRKMSSGDTALLAVLDSKSRWTRMAAVFALGEISSKAALPKLESILKDDQIATVRAAAAVALGRIGGEGSRKSLEAALGDSAPEVREDAVNALGKIGLGSSAPAVLALLDKDEKLGPRFAAVRVLGQAKDKKAVASLEKLTADKYLGEEARRALQEIKPGKKAE